MSISKVSFIFLFTISFYIAKATDFTWINSGDGDYNSSSNWSPTGVPNSSDNIYFLDGNKHTIYDFPMSLGNITIKNNTEITIENFSYLNVSCKNIFIEANSTLKISQTDEGQLKCESGDIYGNVILENAAHSFGFSNSGAGSGLINFNEGSSFTTRTTTTSATSPLNGDATEKVIFLDGSNYFHEEGESPFKDGNYCVFNEGSNYYILNNTNSNHIFAGESYGNIIIGDSEGSNINIDISETSPGIFSFFSLITENGNFRYDNPNVQINIKNELYAESGEINLNCNNFKFISDISISGTYNIEITTYSTSNFIFLDEANYLTLDNNLTLTTSNDISCNGEIDFTTYSINITNNINFSNTAKLITANIQGIYGSFFDGTGYLLGTETTIEYNNNIEFQYIGLPNEYTVGKLIVDNPQNVKMQYDLIIDSLFLEQGNLQIEDYNLLTIQKNIDYNGGHLFGGNTSFLSLIDEVEDVYLDQNLILNTLTIDGINTTVYLDDGAETTLDTLNINSGFMNLNNNSLKVNHEVNLSSGELNIENGTLRIGGIININTGAMLTGGSNSNLEFLSTADNATISINELSNLLIQTHNQITLNTNLTIQDLLNIENGTLSISNELVLNGNVLGDGFLGVDINSNLIIGGAAQDINITFIENSELNNLEVNRPNSTITITNPITINNELELINGKIKPVNELTIGDYCNLSYNSTSYIEIGYSGLVTKNVYENEDFEFPIGTENGFAPITITPNSFEKFTVSVGENVFENSYDGNTITDNRIINLTWDISSTSSNYNLKLNWYDEVVGTEFEQNNSYVSFFNTSTNLWEKITPTTDNNTTNEIKVDGISQTGKFYVSSIYNMAPIIEAQTFEILEHSTTGTIVGQIEATDPDFNNLYFSIQETGENLDAFNFDNNGQITVKNSEILEFSNQPIYKYLATVCDDGEPSECSNANITINVTEFNIEDFYITNYISPNDDGINDTWIINASKDATYKVKIYDKNGNLVYENDNYKNDWTGTNFGTPLPSGVYYYYLTISMTDIKPNYKGTITIVR